MKLSLALTGLTFALCSLAPAQEPTGDRVVVPARNSTRPRKVDVSLLHGTITVKAYNGKEVIVETKGGASTSDAPRVVDGMRRLDLPVRGLSVEEADNQVTVRLGIRSGSHSDLVISVPADTSLNLRSTQGDIEVQGVNGEIDVHTTNGHVTLTNVSGSVVAHSLNGPIQCVLDKVDAAKPLSFSTLNGPIDVTLPADYKANLKITADHGEVWSDFDVKLGSTPVTQKNDTADGKFRVRMDRTMTGTINGGGTDASFRTFNGKISIRKKK